MATRSAAPSPPLLDVRLLWLPEALPGTLFAAADVLRTAALLHRFRRPHEPAPLRWRVVDGAGRRINTPFAPEPGRAPRGRATRQLLWLPGLAAEDAPHLGELMARHGTALRLVREHAAAGGWIAACATGLVMPAHLGLLDGRRVAAPWAFQSWLTRVYPRCDFSGTEPMSHRDRLFTCVAPALTTEFMLRVLGQLLDPDLAQACAQVLLHQPERQQIAPALAQQQWLVRTSDSPVHRAMQWLQHHVDEPYCLKDVATAAAASERTLLRQFQLVTGQTPLQYLHDLRTARAKLLLETTLHGLDAIAQACGYADTASMRRLFKRATGVSMSAHRQRHALRSRRAHWQVRAKRT